MKQPQGFIVQAGQAFQFKALCIIRCGAALYESNIHFTLAQSIEIVHGAVSFDDLQGNAFIGHVRLVLLGEPVVAAVCFAGGYYDTLGRRRLHVVQGNQKPSCHH